MANRMILLLVTGLMVSCINNNVMSIEVWHAGLKSEHPKMINILLQADKGFYFSFNRVNENTYSFFFKRANEHNQQKTVQTWLETYLNEKKLILDAGYPVKSGVSFKQTENFNRLQFIYKIHESESFIFSFRQINEKWQYDGARNE